MANCANCGRQVNPSAWSKTTCWCGATVPKAVKAVAIAAITEDIDDCADACDAIADVVDDALSLFD